MKEKLLANRKAPRVKRFLEILQEDTAFSKGKRPPWAMKDFTLGGRLAARFYCKRGVLFVAGNRVEVRQC